MEPRLALCKCGHKCHCAFQKCTAGACVCRICVLAPYSPTSTPLQSPPKCECGAARCGLPTHSHWCPLR